MTDEQFLFPALSLPAGLVADIDRMNPWWTGKPQRHFIERAVNRAPFGILITQTDDATVDDPRIVTVPLSSLMLLR